MRFGRVEVSGSFFLLFSWLYYQDSQKIVPLTFLACFLHECGHCLALKALHIEIRLIHLSCIGAQIYLKSPLTQLQECFVAFCGPAVNLLLAVYSYFIINNDILFGINLSLAIFNLLPIGQLDGSRILHNLIAWRSSGTFADQILTGVGTALLIVIWLLGCALIYLFRNFTLFLVASWLILRTNLFKKQQILLKELK